MSQPPTKVNIKTQYAKVGLLAGIAIGLVNQWLVGWVAVLALTLALFGLTLENGVLLWVWASTTEQRTRWLDKVLWSYRARFEKPPSGDLREYDVFIGRRVDNNHPVIINLFDMTHTVIFAQTEGGKTTLIYTIIYEILTRYRPDQVQLFICDLKKYSFRILTRIPHLLRPIARPNDIPQFIAALEAEVDRRARLFDSLPGKYMCEDIYTYHELIGKLNLDLPRLPLVIVILDEIQMLIDHSPEAERIVTKLVKEARTVGFRVIGATQRPTGKGLPHEIQSQAQTRICGFMVSAAEYGYARVPPEVYAHMTQTRGRFALKYGGRWAIVQADKIERPVLERIADQLSRGRKPPKWADDEVVQDSEALRRPFEGSAATKRDLVRSWIVARNSPVKPTAGEFLSYFDTKSDSTARKYINEVWPAVAREHGWNF